jgi:menaquinol-cytochrome c reductase iron-sulfur subunit
LNFAQQRPAPHFEQVDELVMTEEHACCQQSGEAAPDDRRLFVKIMAGTVGAVAALVPVGVGLVTFADPATRRERKFSDPSKPAGQKTENGFIRVAALAEVPADGTPLRVAVRDDVTNKWTFSPNEPVGEVFLRKVKDDQGAEQLQVFTTVCPHLGCAISLAKDADGKPIFKCPCHNSSFEIDGKMIPKGNPSPRNMDSLKYQLNDGQVYVKYQNFYTGRTEKQPHH